MSLPGAANIIICGDFNARTGAQPEVTSSQGDSLISQQAPTIHLHLPPRNNFDTVMNSNGRELLQLCRSLSLYMVNSRVRGDSLGRFTYCSTAGNSTVDYMITDMDPFSFTAFTVKPQTPLSDHNQITLFLKHNNITHTKPSKLFNIPRTYRWAPDSTEQYQEASNSEEITLLLEEFIEYPYPPTTEGICEAVRNINYIFNTTANKAKLKLRTNKRKTTKKNHWFDKECQNLKKLVRNKKSYTPSVL